MLVVASVVLIGILLVLGAIFVVSLRRASLDELDVEHQLEEPGAHAVTYSVPTGQDGAVLVAALNHRGYDAVVELVDGTERLLVSCPEEADRGEVRAIIQGVHVTGFEGAEFAVTTVAFDDEA